MKKSIFLFLLLILSASTIEASPFYRNYIVHLNDSSRIISNDFSLPLSDSKKEDMHNPFYRVSDLNISLIKFTSPSDSMVHYLKGEELYSKLKEIEFIQGNSIKNVVQNLKLTYIDDKVEDISDAEILRYKGFKTLTKKISVVRFDEYNNTWIPEYIDFSDIEKIVFRHRDIDLKKKKGKKNKEKDYQKKVLFSSSNFDGQSFYKDLKQALLSSKNNKSNFSSSLVLRVNFNSNSSRLDTRSMKFLDVVGNIMNSPELSNTKFNISGFADSTGKAKRNRTLSKKRANSVKNYLVRNAGVPGFRLKSSGYGSAMPLLPNTTSRNKRINRRVEISPVFY